MILGSHAFWQKTVKYYVIYRVIGFLTPFWVIPMLYVSAPHPLWLEAEVIALLAIFVFCVLAAFGIWLVDRIRFGF